MIFFKKYISLPQVSMKQKCWGIIWNKVFNIFNEEQAGLVPTTQWKLKNIGRGWVLGCLLFTSDAADEGLGVDLGGRRIII